MYFTIKQQVKHLFSILFWFVKSKTKWNLSKASQTSTVFRQRWFYHVGDWLCSSKRRLLVLTLLKRIPKKP